MISYYLLLNVITAVGVRAAFDFNEMKDKSNIYQPLLLIQRRMGGSLELAHPSGYLNGNYSFDNYDLAEYAVCFACPLEHSEEKISSNTIKNKNVLEIVSTVVDNFHSYFTCHSEVLPSIKEVENVSQNLIKFQIGFEIYANNLKTIYTEETTFIKLVDVTFDTRKKIPTSITHTLSAQYLKEIISHNQEKKLVQYSDQDLYLYGFALDHIYNETIQEVIFQDMKSKQKYFNGAIYRFSKRPLIPANDFLLPVHKTVANFNLTTAPIWHCLRITWANAENFLQKVANTIGDIEIQTGTTGILNLPEDFKHSTETYNPNQSTEIYILSGKKQGFLAVPNIFWKIIRHTAIANPSSTELEEKSKGILMVMHNNPHVKSEKICQDISYDNGWLIANDNFRTGLLYFCELNKNNTNQLEITGNVEEYEILNLNVIYKKINKIIT